MYECERVCVCARENVCERKCMQECVYVYFKENGDERERMF